MKNRISDSHFTTQLLIAASLVLVFLYGLRWLLGFVLPKTQPQYSVLLPLAANQLAPEPIERALYLISIVVIPLLLLSIVILFSSRGRIRGLWDRSLSEFLRSNLIGLMLILPLPSSLAIRAIVGQAGLTVQGSANHAYLAFGCALFVILILTWIPRKTWKLPHKVRRLLIVSVLAWAVMTLMLDLLSFRIFSFRHISATPVWSDHLDALISSVAQVQAGHTLLVDAPSQYGLFAELLSLILTIMPEGLLGVTVLFGILQVISILCIMSFMRMRIHSPLVLAAGYGALAMVTFGLHSLCGLRFSEPDPVFQYWPVRFVGPALSVPLIAWVVSRFCWQRLLVLGLWCGACLFWNLDSGAAILYAATMMFILLTGLRLFGVELRGWKAKSLILAAIGVPLLSAIVYLLGLACLSVKAGEPLNLSWIISYQRTFYGLGFGMLPMAGWPDAWFVVLAGYGIAIQLSLVRLRLSSNPSRESTYLFLSLLGVGLFSYFQGRSHFFNLVAVSWPLIVVVAVFTDRHLLGVRNGLIPATSLALPFAGLTSLLLPSLGLIACYPSLLEKALDPPIHRLSLIHI